jgi:hypothetical protein
MNQEIEDAIPAQVILNFFSFLPFVLEAFSFIFDIVRLSFVV